MDGSNALTQTLDAATLSRALRLAAPALKVRHNDDQPALYLRPSNGATSLHAQNLSMAISIAIPSAACFATITLPPRTLPSLLRTSLSTGDITFQPMPNDMLDITTPEFSGQFEAIAPLYQPLLDRAAATTAIRIERAALRHALALCAHAQSVEETRYYLNGIHISTRSADTNALVFAATDGHRLVKHTLQGVTHALPHEIILPRKTVSALQFLLAGTTGTDPVRVLLQAEKLAIAFETDDFTLTTRLIDGSFPDFNRVIPDISQGPALTCTAESMRRFCQRILAIQTKHSRPPLSIQATPGSGAAQVRLEWRGADIGSMSASIDGTAHLPLTIGFQANYILQALQTLNAPNIQLYAKDGASPTVITGADELADPATVYVVMPMRL